MRSTTMELRVLVIALADEGESCRAELLRTALLILVL